MKKRRSSSGIDQKRSASAHPPLCHIIPSASARSKLYEARHMMGQAWPACECCLPASKLSNSPSPKTETSLQLARKKAMRISMLVSIGTGPRDSHATPLRKPSPGSAADASLVAASSAWNLCTWWRYRGQPHIPPQDHPDHRHPRRHHSWQPVCRSRCA